MELADYNTELFSIEHLTVESDVSEFCVHKGKGLEDYLKFFAKGDEVDGISRTYLVRSKESGKIIAYFTLRTGLITVSRGFLKGFDTYTGIELANFAVNDNARISVNEIPKFHDFRYPKTQKNPLNRKPEGPERWIFTCISPDTRFSCIRVDYLPGRFL